MLHSKLRHWASSLWCVLKNESVRLTFGRKLVVAVPYVWLLVFFAFPFFILLRLSFTDMGEGVNPFAAVVNLTQGILNIRLKYQNFLDIFENYKGAFTFDTIYLVAYATSLKYAFFTTFLCLVIGYPFAYFITRAQPRHRPLLLILVMMPFWTSFLLRVYAWKGILANHGILNNALMYMGIIKEPIALLYTDVSILLGMTYVYLPFMVLPLYSVLVKLDTRLLEAAADLGCSPFKAFWLITIPLSRAGIIAGIMLVFIPCVGEFVVPSLLGGANNIMIGRVIWDEMFANNNWPRASALSVVMILLITVPFALYLRQSKASNQA